MDISDLTGLKPHGILVNFFLSRATECPEFGPDSQNTKFYSHFLDDAFSPNIGKVVIDKDHLNFLIFWLCSYIFCASALQITQDFFYVILALARW